MAPELPTAANAERMAAQVGAITLVIGGALAVAPARVGNSMGLDPAGARVIGLADLALVPGLLRGRPRWPWMTARAGFNLATAAYGFGRERRGARRIGALSRALVAITAVDAAVASTLWRAEAR